MSRAVSMLEATMWRRSDRLDGLVSWHNFMYGVHESTKLGNIPGFVNAASLPDGDLGAFTHTLLNMATHAPCSALPCFVIAAGTWIATTSQERCRDRGPRTTT